MEILHIAVPGAILLVGLAIAIFWWAVKHGQFDDLERQGMNILLDEAPTKRNKTASQSGQAPRANGDHRAAPASESTHSDKRPPERSNTPDA